MRLMQENSILRNITQFGEAEQIKFFTYDQMLYISVPDSEKRTGYCVVYQLTGKVEARQELSVGINAIEHLFSEGDYLITMSFGSKMIIDKVTFADSTDEKL